MSKWITTSFVNNSEAPLTGLTPIIRIRDLSDNSLVVTDASMSEVGDGIYKYNFESYDASKDYAIRCDANVVIVGRYRFSTTSQDIEEDVTDVKDLLLDVQSDIDVIKEIETGRWKILNNQMIFYKSDNVTEIARFNLFNSSGTLSETDVYERQRV